MTEASGERRSCDTEESSAVRRRSVSPSTRAASRLATSRVRSAAWAICWTIAPASWWCSEERNARVGGKRMPITPRQPPSTISGTNHQLDPERVLVKRPAGCVWTATQSAAAASFGGSSIAAG